MGQRPVVIAPSILSADFARLGEEVKAVEAAGADWIHVDVMDGMFVPNITFGPDVVAAVAGVTDLPLDVHLMIEQPERYVPEYVEKGAATVGVHVETCPHLHRNVTQIREAGARSCVVLNPGTPASSIEPVLDHVDQVLEHPRPRDGAVLGHMPDQHERHTVFLRRRVQLVRRGFHLTDRAGR